jgi:hypothetical protein
VTTATSLAGTNAKCRNVRFCADIGVIAGVTQTSFEDRFSLRICYFTNLYGGTKRRVGPSSASAGLPGNPQDNLSARMPLESLLKCLACLLDRQHAVHEGA